MPPTLRDEIQRAIESQNGLGGPTPTSIIVDAVMEVLAVHPIDMVLFCPSCGKQHIDAPDPAPWCWPPHRSHLCRGCGYTWRPADVPTNGVEAVKTAGKRDHPRPAPLDVRLASIPALAELVATPRPGPPDFDLKQIIHALERHARQQQALADKLHDERDYSAEFPAADAERLREAAALLAGMPWLVARVPMPSPDSVAQGLTVDPNKPFEFDPGQNWSPMR